MAFNSNILTVLMQNLEKFLNCLSKEHQLLAKTNLKYEISKDLTNVDKICPQWNQFATSINKIIDEYQKQENDQNKLSSNRKNSCKICRKQFATNELLEFHCKNTHQEKNEKKSDLVVEDLNDLSVFCCLICYQTYSNKESFLLHNCANAKKTANQEAPKYLNNLNLLQQHNRFLCGICGEEFRQYNRICYHLNRCRKENLICHLCSKRYSSRKDLNSHKKCDHVGEYPFQCEECPKRFQMNTSLQKHISQQHENKKSSFPCDKCGKRFTKQIFLTNHQTRFHNLFKSILCQVCGDRFLSSESLKSHMKIHENPKKYHCTMCDKAFHRKDKLKFHLATHTGEKPHQCTICKKSFVRKSKLMDHIRRHRGEKRFSCLGCRKMYSVANDLRHHLRKHHPNLSKNLKPNLPLAPQIIDNLSLRTLNANSTTTSSSGRVQSAEYYLQNKSDMDILNITQEEDLFEIDIEELRTINLPIQELNQQQNLNL